MLAGDLGSLNCGLKIRKKNLTPEQPQLAAFLQEAFEDECSPAWKIAEYQDIEFPEEGGNQKEWIQHNKIQNKFPPSLQKFKPNLRVPQNSLWNFKSMAVKPPTSHSKPTTEIVMGYKW